MDDGPCNQEEINRRKIEKSIQIKKLLELGKTRTKKASPDMSNFYVVMTDHHKVTDASRATTYRLKLKAPSLQTKSTKTDGPFENKFHEKTV